MPAATGEISMRTATLTAATLCLVALATSSAAVVHQVDTAGTGDHPTIQAAIDACAAGDTVLCAPGVYTGSGNRGLNFGGVDLVLRSSAGAGLTTIDAEWGDRGVVFESGETRASIVEGFTITHCRGLFGGGAVMCYDGSPTLRDLRLIGNSSPGEVGYFHGAGITCWDSEPRLESVVFRGNIGEGGGAMQIYGIEAAIAPELVNVEFSGDNWGGLLIQGSARPVFEDVVFAESNYYPSLEIVMADSLVLEGLIFRDNMGGNNGRAIRCVGGHLTVRDCLFHDNGFEYSNTGDGIIHLTDTELVMESCTIAHSRGGFVGGAVLALHEPRDTRIERTLIEGGLRLAGVWWDGLGETPELICNDVHGHMEGNYAGALVDPTGTDGNISEDPRFCGPINDLGFLYTLSADSPCLPANNDCGQRIGAFGEGCPAPTAVAESPVAARLLAPAPNPFNPWTRLRFSLRAEGRVILSLHDLTGRRLRVLAARQFEPGSHELDWDGRDAAGRELPSGVYLARMTVGDRVESRKLTLLR